MASTYEPIATQTLGTTTATVTFSSISGTYTDLILIATAQRGINGAGESGLSMTFNGDSSALYSSTLLYEAGPSSTRQTGQTSLGYVGSAGDGGFVTNVIHIMNYSNSTTYKTLFSRYGYTQGNNITRMSANLWRNTNAITSISMTPANGFATGSIFTLYGIKAA